VERRGFENFLARILHERIQTSQSHSFIYNILSSGSAALRKGVELIQVNVMVKLRVRAPPACSSSALGQ
jgi:hypothetical protein